MWQTRWRGQVPPHMGDGGVRRSVGLTAALLPPIVPYPSKTLMHWWIINSFSWEKCRRPHFLFLSGWSDAWSPNSQTDPTSEIDQWYGGKNQTRRKSITRKRPMGWGKKLNEKGKHNAAKDQWMDKTQMKSVSLALFPWIGNVCPRTYGYLV